MKFFQTIFCNAVLLCCSSLACAQSCNLTPVAVKVRTKPAIAKWGDELVPVEAAYYTAKTKYVEVTWVEKGDPADEAEIWHTSMEAPCTVKSSLTFNSFSGDKIYSAQQGRYVLLSQGIGSHFAATIYATTSCQIVGMIPDMYPEGVSAPVIVKENTVTVGIKNTTYVFNSDCVPVRLEPRKGEEKS